MNGYDGPSWRSVRESQGVPLRRVARQAAMSHGHLSKVERGEPGRPVTPAVLAAYEKATGVRLTGIAGHDHSDGGGWRRGHLSEARRRTLNAKVAAVAVGGPLGEQINRILDATGRTVAPPRVEAADVVQVEHIAALCTGLDLQLGGGVCHEMARALLRWAVGLLDAPASEPVAARLYAAVGALAQRAGWAAFDADSHEVARSLFTIGLYAATRADDADLRAHLLADLGGQHNYLGYPDDCLQVVRFGEVDERVGPAVRMVLNGVKARAYAVKGDTGACRRHVGLAEVAQGKAAAAGSDGWLATIATPGRLLATTGHALASLARRTGTGAAREEALQRLTSAVEQLDHQRQARNVVLCVAQLATLHLETDWPGPGVVWARQALTVAAGIRSTRLVEHLHTMRTAAASHDSDSAMGELVDSIDAAVGVAADERG